MSQTMQRLFLLFAVGLALPTACHACATLSDMPVRTTDESALIVWDAKSHIEQFVRRASFETNDKDFGFLVPTPSRPQLSVVEDSLFDQLETELEPKAAYRVRVWQDWSLWGAFSHSKIKRTFSKAADSMVPTDEDLKVIEQKRIGGYDTAILKANDPRQIKQWLRSHRYPSTAGFENWLASYTQRGWYLTAFKISHETKEDSPQLKAVNMKFLTQTPFYPYREPKTARKQRDGRTLRIFYLGTNRPAVRVENGSRNQAWLASTDYSAPIKTPALASKNLSLPSETLRLTAFLDKSSPRSGWGEL